MRRASLRLRIAISIPLALPCLAADRPIQDNSFLLEEAYNQESRVVQHIGAFQRFRNGGWGATFTQEWPGGSQTHQLSYTLAGLAPPGGNRGVGDVLLNYRYQATGSGDAQVAFAPRASLVVPVGDERAGRGDRSWGAQANLPLSVVLGPRAVTHTNLGFTWLPRARNSVGDRAQITAWSFGQSFVWLARSKFNVLAELAFSTGREVVGPDATSRSDAFFFNPGVRWAHDLPRGLQIVPGVAFPVGLGASRGERAVFLYLSFEHPF